MSLRKQEGVGISAKVELGLERDKDSSHIMVREKPDYLGPYTKTK